MSVITHWPEGRPLTLYRYGTEWTSVERGYPHQDADAKVEVIPSTDTSGAVGRMERAAALLARVGVGDKPMAAKDGEDVQAAYRILTGGQSE